MRDFPETKVTYKGETFFAPGYQDAPLRYQLVTNDEAIAQRLGFAPDRSRAGRFERWLDARDAERVVTTRAYGLYHGVRVFVFQESARGYQLQSEHDLPGLEQLERGVWAGEVPKEDLERFWTEEEIEG